MQNSTHHREAKKLAEEIHHISELDRVYSAYEEYFADIVARYAIKAIIDHEVEYGHYHYLHDVLLSHHYLNKQEKERIKQELDKAALNCIKRHTIPFYSPTKWFNESHYQTFQRLVKIIYADYLSQPVREKAEKLVLKRIKNKKEHSALLFTVKDDENLPENMRAIARNSLEEQDKMGLGKYVKR